MCSSDLYLSGTGGQEIYYIYDALWTKPAQFHYCHGVSKENLPIAEEVSLGSIFFNCWNHGSLQKGKGGREARREDGSEEGREEIETAVGILWDQREVQEIFQSCVLVEDA